MCVCVCACMCVCACVRVCVCACVRVCVCVSVSKVTAARDCNLRFYFFLCIYFLLVHSPHINRPNQFATSHWNLSSISAFDLAPTANHQPLSSVGWVSQSLILSTSSACKIKYFFSLFPRGASARLRLTQRNLLESGPKSG